MLIGFSITFLFYFLYVYLLSRGARYYHEREATIYGNNEDRILDSDKRLRKTNYLFLIGGLLSIGLLTLFGYIFPDWFVIPEGITNRLNALYYMHFVQVGLVEELFKYIVFVLMFGFLTVNKRKILDTPSLNKSTDAIFKYLMAVGVGLGFGIYETLLFVINNPIDYNGLFIRLTMPTMLHMVCGSFMGLLFLEGSKDTLRTVSKWTLRLLALLLPVFVHGTYNIMVLQTESNVAIYMFIIALMVFNIPLLASNKLIK